MYEKTKRSYRRKKNLKKRTRGKRVNLKREDKAWALVLRQNNLARLCPTCLERQCKCNQPVSEDWFAETEYKNRIIEASNRYIFGETPVSPTDNLGQIVNGCFVMK